MKMHRILAEAAAGIVKAVFRDHKVLDHVLAAEFEANPKWGKRDRAFIAETVFEVVRWRRALSFLADSEEAKALCAAQWVRMGYEIPEWWSYRGNGQEQILAREAELVDQPRAVRESIPDWLDELGEKELGEEWGAELSALNQRASVYLRVNRMRTTREAAIAWLAEGNLQVGTIEGMPDTLVLPSQKALPKTMRYDGRVEIQDAGSQMIAPLLGVQPGLRIIDACSGAGGKTLHIASLLQNEGKIYAMDVDKRKLQELERRAKRASVHKCIKTVAIEDGTIDDFVGVADRLLIDAPCSGLGTLKRQPDLKWRLKPAAIERSQAIQREILVDYARMLKVGGRLVYATCSILPSENQEAVRILLEHGGFELQTELKISPSKFGYDGFYCAVLIKTA